MLVDHDVGRGAAVEGHHGHAAGQGLVDRRRVDLALARLDEHVEGGDRSGPVRGCVACGITLAPAVRSILAPGPSPSTTRRTPGSWAIVASRLRTFCFSRGPPTWPTTSWPPSGECTRAQRSWSVLVAQPGVVVGEVDAGPPGARVQHEGGYAEPLGRLGGLDAEPVRVDQVADVGPGEGHRLADRADRGHPARPEDAGAPEGGLAAARGEHGRRRARRRRGGTTISRVTRAAGVLARQELLGDQCDAHASMVALCLARR